MQWVCWIEIQGLYAAAARTAGLVPEGRAVVVTRGGRVFDGCQEAFVAGLQLGSPLHQVLRDVPRAVQVDFADIDPLQHVRPWWERCLSHTPYVEPLEPHQVLLSLPVKGTQLTRQLQQEVESLVEQAATYGFVAFAGVGASRLVARAAALTCKEGYLVHRPGRATATPRQGERISYVSLGEEERFLAPLPIGYLPCQPDLARRLTRLGLQRIGEVARIGEAEWIRQLGGQGRQLSHWSHGIDPDPVRPAYPPRRLTRRKELGLGIRDRDLLERELNRAALLLGKQLERRGEGGQLVALVLELANGRVLHAERTLPKLQQAAYPLQQGLQGLLSQVLATVEEEVLATAITAEIGLIGPIDWRQMALWDDHLQNERQERVEKALALLHERFPVRVVGLGVRNEPSWREQMLQYTDPYRWPDRGA